MAKDTKSAEAGAKDALVEDLFNDFYSNRWRIYRTNFFRGIAFGVGSLLGGTLVIALLIWLLDLLVDLPGVLGDFVQFIVDSVKR